MYYIEVNNRFFCGLSKKNISTAYYFIAAKFYMHERDATLDIRRLRSENRKIKLMKLISLDATEVIHIDL